MERAQRSSSSWKKVQDFSRLTGSFSRGTFVGFSVEIILAMPSWKQKLSWEVWARDNSGSPRWARERGQYKTNRPVRAHVCGVKSREKNENHVGGHRKPHACHATIQGGPREVYFSKRWHEIKLTEYPCKSPHQKKWKSRTKPINN